MRTIIPSFVAALALLFAATVLANQGSVTLNPGQESVVGTLDLKAGDVVEYNYATGLDTTFRVVRAGTEVYNSTGVAVHGSFTAPADGTYAFSFRNDGSNLTIISYTITPPANSMPLLIAGAGIAAFVGIAGAVVWMRTRRRAPAIPPTQAPPPPPS